MRRRIAVGGGVLAVAVLAGGIAVLGGDDDPGAPAAARAAVGDTASVERRDLVDRDEVDGTLGYADGGTLAAGAAGTLTALPDPGTVVKRGEPLYDVDNAPAAFLFYGALPAWRDFTPWMGDGEDIRQLERNLRALGHDPDGDLTIDDEWDWATTAAVERFQDEHGLEEDGSLEQGQVVFRSGATRIGEPKATVGDPVSPGKPLVDVSSTERRVTVDLEATRQRLAREGDSVTVELPTGRTARGRILEVGKVAEQPAAEEDTEPTIEVTIALRGKAARGTGLDQAPVDVGFAVQRAKDALAVPVKALLARQGGGFAVEVVGDDGAHRMVDVEPGLYADDFVEVEGDLREGQTVVTAR
jgi:peptidoglycan hydrolase-like protein with peptidoglycan-binding domain